MRGFQLRAQVVTTFGTSVALCQRKPGNGGQGTCRGLFATSARIGPGGTVLRRWAVCCTVVPVRWSPRLCIVGFRIIWGADSMACCGGRWQATDRHGHGLRRVGVSSDCVRQPGSPRSVKRWVGPARERGRSGNLECRVWRVPNTSRRRSSGDLDFRDEFSVFARRQGRRECGFDDRVSRKEPF